MVVDFDGQPVATALRPSAETLHTRLYRRFAEVGCVLHTHSPVQTIASRLYAARGHVRLQGYELLKALHGNTTHDTALDLPVFPNTGHDGAGRAGRCLAGQAADVGLPDRRPRPVCMGSRHGRGTPPSGSLRVSAAYELELRKLRGPAADAATA
jgi:hypothetical protein